MPQLRWHKFLSPLTKRVGLYLLIVCLIGFQCYAGAFGIRPTRDDIAKALGASVKLRILKSSMPANFKQRLNGLRRIANFSTPNYPRI